MSLNKFTDTQKGLDIEFEIGCKDLVASGGIFKQKKILEDMTSATPKGIITGATYVQNTGVECNLDQTASVLYTDTNFNYFGKIEGEFEITNNVNTIFRAIMGKNAVGFDTIDFAYTPSGNTLSIQSIINGVSTVLYNGLSENPNYRRFKFHYIDAELNDTSSSSIKLEMAEVTGEYTTIFDSAIVGVPQFELEGGVVVNAGIGNDLTITDLYVETYETFTSKPSPTPPTPSYTALGQIYMRNNTIPTEISVLDQFYPILGIPVINSDADIDFTENQGQLQYTGDIEQYALITFSISARISLGQEYQIRGATAVFKNGVEIVGSTLTSHIQSDDETVISGTCFTKLSKNDALGINLKSLTNPGITVDDIIVTDYLLSAVTIGAV
jgi:hypothetical protein